MEGTLTLASWNKCSICISSPIPSFYARPHHTSIIFHLSSFINAVGPSALIIINFVMRMWSPLIKATAHSIATAHGGGGEYFSNPLFTCTARDQYSVIVLCLLCGGGTSSTAGQKCGGL
ncbi:hypothetical protein NC651_031613 [Populus alba x Populus x berolinensis]|nr:hypothetical protein NC651_031613 [Populus alba x Populus x berolinensis]